jgi:hypothetical protein
MTDDYQPPLKAINRALAAVGLAEVLALPRYEHLGAEDVTGCYRVSAASRPRS